MSRDSRLAALDLKVLWHPFTQQAEWAKDFRRSPLLIEKGRGVHLYDSRGKKYLDGVSSLWANLLGHNHPWLNRAIRRQLGRVAHSTFLGLSHEPGIRLAEEILRFAPKNLSRVFYSDNGSTAVEVALKMAFQYQIHSRKSGGAACPAVTSRCDLRQGNAPRAEFLALKNSYHGDTVGSVSVGGIDIFHRTFRPLLFRTHFAMSPHCLSCPHRRKEAPRLVGYSYAGENPSPGEERPATGCRWQCLGEVETILRKRRGRIAAAVLEPVVQGAGGMIVMPPGYLKGFAALCKRFGVPLIADEVATGFGRTGRLFAVNHEDVAPDFLCLSKGLSGGYLPLAATLTEEKVYRAFLGRYDEFKTFFHGHTYTANPLACAAGRAVLETLQKEGILRKVKKLESVLEDALRKLLSIPQVAEIRRAGLMCGVEVMRDPARSIPFAPGQRVGKRICEEARRHGILLRPLGDVIVLLPPLSIRPAEIRRLVDGVEKSMRAVLAGMKK